MSSSDESKCCADKCKDDECEVEASCLIESSEACKCGQTCDCADCKCCPKYGTKPGSGHNGVCACGDSCKCTICPCCAPSRAHCIAAKCDELCHQLDADNKDTCVQHKHHDHHDQHGQHAHHDHDHHEQHEHHDCENKSC